MHIVRDKQKVVIIFSKSYLSSWSALLWWYSKTKCCYCRFLIFTNWRKKKKKRHFPVRVGSLDKKKTAERFVSLSFLTSSHRGFASQKRSLVYILLFERCEPYYWAIVFEYSGGDTGLKSFSLLEWESVLVQRFFCDDIED